MITVMHWVPLWCLCAGYSCRCFCPLVGFNLAVWMSCDRYPWGESKTWGVTLKVSLLYQQVAAATRSAVSTCKHSKTSKQKMYRRQYKFSCCVICREVVLFLEVQKLYGNKFFGTLKNVLCRDYVIVVSQYYALPFLHTTFSLKWGGGLNSNIWLVSTIRFCKCVGAAKSYNHLAVATLKRCQCRVYMMYS